MLAVIILASVAKIAHYIGLTLTDLALGNCTLISDLYIDRYRYRQLLLIIYVIRSKSFNCLMFYFYNFKEIRLSIIDDKFALMEHLCLEIQ